MELTEFLLARIAEDEVDAKDIPAGTWEDACSISRRYEHVFRWSPARVLAECEVKRRIVEAVSEWRHDVNQEDCWYTCPAAREEVDGGECCDDLRREAAHCDCGLAYRQRSILAPLALPYADHPDYREEWKP